MSSQQIPGINQRKSWIDSTSRTRCQPLCCHPNSHELGLLLRNVASWKQDEHPSNSKVSNSKPMDKVIDSIKICALSEHRQMSHVLETSDVPNKMRYAEREDLKTSHRRDRDVEKR